MFVLQFSLFSVLWSLSLFGMFLCEKLNEPDEMRGRKTCWVNVCLEVTGGHRGSPVSAVSNSSSENTRGVP